MTATFAVGRRAIGVARPHSGQLAECELYYPALAALSSPEPVPDAPPAAGCFPLLVISHGAGGGPFTQRSLALHLAQHGHIVAVPAHPTFDPFTITDAELERLLIERVALVSGALDAVLSLDEVGRVADATRIGVVGHSAGGATALALAGGLPWSRQRQAIATTPDPRVRTLVLLAPAAGFFMAPGALAAVRQPILLLAGTRDTLIPAEWVENIVQHCGAPERVERHWIDGAGHLSFLGVQPDPARQRALPPHLLPPDFDHAAFQPRLRQMIGGFLARTLPT